MIINGIKFACNTCVKGHRSSNCNHTDRPLFEIRRKGRPVTQCTYCKDLKKMKQMKCSCHHQETPCYPCLSKKYYAIPEEEGVSYADILNGSNTSDHSHPFNPNCTCPETSKILSNLTKPYSRSRQSSTSSTFRFIDGQTKSPRRQKHKSIVIPHTEEEEVPVVWDKKPLMTLCGSLMPHADCNNTLMMTEGESVVITITPLSNMNSNMMTRVVTCYAGPSCSCSGCLVHPNPFLVPTMPYMYAGSSSSSSSSSDDEDLLYHPLFT